MKKRIHLELRNRTPSDVSRAFLKTEHFPSSSAAVTTWVLFISLFHFVSLYRSVKHPAARASSSCTGRMVWGRRATVNGYFQTAGPPRAAPGHHPRFKSFCCGTHGSAPPDFTSGAPGLVTAAAAARGSSQPCRKPCLLLARCYNQSFNQKEE